MEIDEPLKRTPFSSFTHRLGDKNIENKINDQTSIYGLFRRTHFFSRAADRFWNRAFRKEEKKSQGGEE